MPTPAVKSSKATVAQGKVKDASTVKPPAAASSKAAATMPPTVISSTTKPQASAKFAAQPLPSQLTGKFDVYTIGLPFLAKEYLPNGAKTPNFKAVYEKILFYQAKPDFSLRIALREEVGQTQSTGGRVDFRGCITNPISDEPLEGWVITGGKTSESINFSAAESAHPSTAGTGWGYEAEVEMDDSEDGCGCGMINSGKGTFKLRKVWSAPGIGEDGEKKELELFEGRLSIKIDYGPTLRRKGFGTGAFYPHSVWAVRALKKDGKEVGIDAGDGMYVSTTPYSPTFDDDEDDDDEDNLDGGYGGYGDSDDEDSDDFATY